MNYKFADELRAYAGGCDSFRQASLCTIADDLDAAHEKALSEQFKSLTIDMEPMTEENMSKNGWVKLPRDADGKPINVGDVLTDGKNTYTITSIAFNSCNVIVYGCTETNKSEWPIDQKSKMHHVEHVTVDDVLRELVAQVSPDAEWEDELFAEYADRIKEAVEHE